MIPHSANICKTGQYHPPNGMASVPGSGKTGLGTYTERPKDYEKIVQRLDTLKNFELWQK